MTQKRQVQLISCRLSNSFIRKLGGRKPTHSGKSPIHATCTPGISPQIDNFEYFLYDETVGKKSNVLKCTKTHLRQCIDFQKSFRKWHLRPRFKGMWGGRKGEGKGRKEKENGYRPATSFGINVALVAEATCVHLAADNHSSLNVSRAHSDTGSRTNSVMMSSSMSRETIARFTLVTPAWFSC